MPEKKVKVKSHERTIRSKKISDKPAELTPTNAAPARGTQIIERDPTRHGKVKPLTGVTILGKGGSNVGVKRVSR